MRKILLRLVMVFMFGSIAFGADKWIEIPVVVNVVDNSDDSKVKDAIKKANEIFKQAKIKLVVKKTNKPFNVGNNDGNLTENEGDKAQKQGKKELKKVAGAGKGLKLTIADDVWVEDPNTNGWAIHRNPVVFVEPDADVNVMGKTIAHEMCHSLTLENDLYDINDINDLMYGYTDRGTTIAPNDINEIRTTAKKRGRTFTIKPEILPGNRKETVGSGISRTVEAHGAVLDEFSDQIINDQTLTLTDPNDPTVTYSDLREIIVFAEDPLTAGTNMTIDIELAGLIPIGWPVDLMYDVFFDVNAAVPGPEYSVNIQLQNRVVMFAELQDLVNIGSPPIPVTVLVHQNDKFDADSTKPNNKIPWSHSLEVVMPVDFLQLSLVSADPIMVDIQSQVMDMRFEIPVMIFDDALPFEFGLSGICQSPSIGFSGGSAEPAGSCGDQICFRWDLHGCGFTPNSLFEARIGDMPIGGTSTLQADGNGNLVIANIGSSGLDGVSQDPLPPIEYEVFVQELNDTGPTGAPHAFGVFEYDPFGLFLGDIDGDGDVDLDDFALMAGNWLVGK